MLRSLNSAMVFCGALLIGAALGATSSVSPARANPVLDAATAARPVSEAQQPYDPSKKRPGDECKSADECQKHHSCVPDGDKKVCQAPPRPRLPPGAVT